ncbi:unnamed protein product [Callosobruchus maculatus]|uniref:Dimethyladenosine transferase 2, mitochondrial n=1 Tax=Callosobruchus maculatus TaxID=64391 RepID=A0A653DJC8_CALMS|nr:unnamed protein product [Callosobruchus maculatus]
MYVQSCSRSFVNRFCRRLSRLSKIDSTEPTKHPESSSDSVTNTRVPHTHELYYLFTTNPHIENIKKYIPPKYFLRPNKLPADNIYLICPKTATKIADIVFKYLRSTKAQVVAETNAGLGLIATELLDRGLDLIRLYESCPEFREELRDIADVYPGRVELFTKSIYQMNRYAYADKQDNGNRIETLLKGVPKRSWSDDPVMTIIGAMGNIGFLKYLVRSASLQSGPALYGRIQLFAIIKAKHYAVLSATPENHVRHYSCWTILFNLFFDYELLEEFPRKLFLPWDPYPKSNDLWQNLTTRQRSRT